MKQPDFILLNPILGTYSLKQKEIVFNNVTYAIALEELFDNIQNSQRIDDLKNEIIQKYDLTRIKHRISEFRHIFTELKKTISITQNIKEKLDLYNESSQNSLEFITRAYDKTLITNKYSKKYNECKDLISQAVIKPFGFTFGAYLPSNELNKLHNLNLSQIATTLGRKIENPDGLRVNGFVSHLRVTNNQIPFFFANIDYLNQENEDLFAENFNLTPYKKEFINDEKRIRVNIVKYHEYKHIIDNIIQNNLIDKQDIFPFPFYLSELSADLYASPDKLLIRTADLRELMRYYTFKKNQTEKRVNEYIMGDIRFPEFLIKNKTKELKKRVKALKEAPRKLKEIHNLCSYILQENILSARKLSYLVATNSYDDDHLKNNLHILINYYPTMIK